MDDTRELISAAVFIRCLLAVAGVVLVGGLAAGVGWGRRSGAPRAGLQRGLAAGLLGPAALLLWAVYNLFEDRYGLDSVKALVINLVIFVLFGALAGALLAWTWHRTEPLLEPP